MPPPPNHGGSSPQGWRSSVSAMRSPVVEAEAPKDSGSCWVGLSGFLPKCEVIDVLRRLHRLHSASSKVVGISWLNSEWRHVVKLINTLPWRSFGTYKCTKVRDVSQNIIPKAKKSSPQPSTPKLLQRKPYWTDKLRPRVSGSPPASYAQLWGWLRAGSSVPRGEIKLCSQVAYLIHILLLQLFTFLKPNSFQHELLECSWIQKINTFWKVSIQNLTKHLSKLPSFHPLAQASDVSPARSGEKDVIDSQIHPLGPEILPA